MTTGCTCDSNAPHWHRSAVREREAVAWEVGYLRGVRDNESDLERADNPFDTSHLANLVSNGQRHTIADITNGADNEIAAQIDEGDADE